ncbi:MAG: hypothetical protein ACM357_07415 [Gemmatimonadota bacterium]
MRRAPLGLVLSASLLSAILLRAMAAPPSADGQSAAGPSEVYVLATLYQRHDSTPAYDHATLRALIERIAPDVVVLDVSPTELREQSVHPSKREYPEVIFPLVRERGLRAYAGEPDEPEFTRIVQGLGAALGQFRSAHPGAAAADRAYQEATFRALAHLWRTPADVNGALTDQLLAARRAYQDRVAGPEVAEAWRRWNEHAVAIVRQAQRENPGGRILVLVGVENCARLRASLARLPELRVVDMEEWLGGR